MRIENTWHYSAAILVMPLGFLYYTQRTPIKESYNRVELFFSPFSIAITSLGEESANLNAFHTFIRFVLVLFCRFPLPQGCGL